jgi:hypothetical protein
LPKFVGKRDNYVAFYQEIYLIIYLNITKG